MNPQGLRARSLALGLAVLASCTCLAGMLPQEFPLLAQRLRHVDQGSGLSQNSVTAMAQDHHGRLWLGTQNGLNRYDGNDMVVYRGHPDVAGSLGNNRITAIAVDRQGRVWVGTHAGLYRHEAATDTFRAFRHGPGQVDGPAGNQITALHIDADGVLWVGSEGGLSQWQDARGGFLSYVPPGAPLQAADPRVTAIADAGAGRLWLGTGAGLQRFDRALGAFDRDFPPPPTGQDLITCLLRDRAGQLWLGSRLAGLARYEPASRHWLHFPQGVEPLAGSAASWIASLLQDRQGQLWVGSAAGLERIAQPDAAQPTGERLLHHRHHRNGLAPGRIASLLQDREGNLWFGSWDGGASVLSGYHNRFQSFGIDHPLMAPLASASLSSMRAAGETLWLGSERGLAHFDASAFRAQPTALPARWIYAIRILPTGLWLGTDRGTHAIDASGQARAAELPAGLDARGIGRLWLDGDRLWAGESQIGLHIVSLSRRELVVTHGHASTFFHFIEPFDGTRVLVGAADGLYWYSRDGRRLLHRLALGSGGLSHAPSDFLRGRDGRAWLTTYGGGLIELVLAEGDPPANAQLKVHAEAQGLADPALNSVLEDDAGELWLAADSGIARFEPDTGRFTLFDREDGAFDTAYRFGVAAKLASGRLAFGGRNGFTLFDPAQMVAAARPAAPLLTALEGDGRSLRASASGWPSPSSLRLGAGQADRLRLGFASPDLLAAQRLHYRYRLHGFDAQWTQASSDQREASYTRLPPGEFVFEVQAVNRDGVVGPSTRLALQVEPHWWQTLFAKLALVAASIAMLAALYRWRVRQLRRQRDALERQVGQRTEELRQALDRLLSSEQRVIAEKLAAAGQLTAGVAHEINNPAGFTWNAAQELGRGLDDFHAFLRRLAGDDAEPEVLASFEQRFAGLREHLQTISEGSGRVREIAQDLRNFARKDDERPQPARPVALLQTTLNLVRTQYRHDIAFVTEFGADPTLPCYPGRLSQVFMNLLVNACQAVQSAPAAEGGRVTLRTRAADGWLHIEVADNGPGVSPDARAHLFEPFFTTKPVGVGTGLGLAVSLGIVSEHGGSIDFESEPGQGSTFRVRLPLAGLE